MQAPGSSFTSGACASGRRGAAFYPRDGALHERKRGAPFSPPAGAAHPLHLQGGSAARKRGGPSGQLPRRRAGLRAQLDDYTAEFQPHPRPAAVSLRMTADTGFGKGQKTLRISTASLNTWRGSCATMKTRQANGSWYPWQPNGKTAGG